MLPGLRHVHVFVCLGIAELLMYDADSFSNPKVRAEVEDKVVPEVIKVLQLPKA